MIRQFFIYFIYPILTIIFASQSSIIEDNLSIVGNLEGKHLWFIGWGICTQVALGLGFFGCLKHSIHQKQLKPLILLASILNMIAIVLPYQPNRFPQLSRYHVGISFISLLSMLVLVGFLVTSLMINHQIFHFYLMFVVFCLAIMGYYLHCTYVNSLIEICVAIATPIYLDQLRRFL